MGDDGDYNTDLDNAHMFDIKAVLGGVNVNNETHSAAFTVDNSLCDGLYFSDGRPVLPMPASYYSILGDQMVITPGNVLRRSVRVQLSDSYFEDPASVETTYVIPIVLTSSADSILQGKPKDGIANPRRLVKDDWAKQPKRLCALCREI